LTDLSCLNYIFGTGIVSFVFPESFRGDYLNVFSLLGLEISVGGFVWGVPCPVKFMSMRSGAYLTGVVNSKTIQNDINHFAYIHSVG